MKAKDMEKRLSLLFNENRLATFKNWVFNDDDACSAAKMAEAGFYFTGNDKERDSVACFLCEKALDGWEATDDPWTEHVRHSPDCEFAKLMLAEEALSYYQFFDIKGDLMKRLFAKNSAAAQQDLDNKYEEMKRYVMLKFK